MLAERDFTTEKSMHVIPIVREPSSGSWTEKMALDHYYTNSRSEKVHHLVNSERQMLTCININSLAIVSHVENNTNPWITTKNLNRSKDDHFKMHSNVSEFSTFPLEKNPICLPIFSNSNTNTDDMKASKPKRKGHKVIARQLRQFLESLKSRQNFKSRSSAFSCTPSLPYKARRDSAETLWAICCRIAHNEPHSIANSSSARNDFTLENLRLTLKSLDSTSHELRLPPPIPEAAIDDFKADSLRAFVNQLPHGCQNISMKADPSGLVARLLPISRISYEARYIGSAFWLWLCAIDDLTEELQGEVYEIAIRDIRNAFNGIVSEESPSDVAIASFALLKLVNSTKLYAPDQDIEEAAWRSSFLTCVLEVLRGFDEERPLLRSKGSGGKIALRDWMNVRVVTISARPFMVLARASLGLSTSLSESGFPLDMGEHLEVFSGMSTPSLASISSITDGTTRETNTPSNEYPQLFDLQDACTTDSHLLNRIEILIQCVLGLENDILGWEKDHKEQNPLNAIEILFDQGFTPFAAMTNVVAVHNNLVERAASLATTLLESVKISKQNDIVEQDEPVMSSGDSGYFATSCTSDGMSKAKLQNYVELLLGFSNGMAMWSSTCKRYVAV